MTSCRIERELSFILSNSSIQHIPRSLNTNAPDSKCKSPHQETQNQLAKKNKSCSWPKYEISWPKYEISWPKYEISRPKNEIQLAKK